MSVSRFTFWYGWLWGLTTGLFIGLCVALMVYADSIIV